MKLVAISLSTMLLVACSSDPETLLREGNLAQAAGDSDEALSKFNQALEYLSPISPKFIDAKLGVVEALITDEPGRASEELLALADQFPNQIGDREFALIANKMITLHQYLAALDLVHSGMKRTSKESPHLLQVIERIK